MGCALPHAESPNLTMRVESQMPDAPITVRAELTPDSAGQGHWFAFVVSRAELVRQSPDARRFWQRTPQIRWRASDRLRLASAADRLRGHSLRAPAESGIQEIVAPQQLNVDCEPGMTGSPGGPSFAKAAVPVSRQETRELWRQPVFGSVSVRCGYGMGRGTGVPYPPSFSRRRNRGRGLEVCRGAECSDILASHGRTSDPRDTQVPDRRRAPRCGRFGALSSW